MNNDKIDMLVQQMENHLECWKQFNDFLQMAREKRFSPDDENQFLELKSLIIQELELILAAIECTSPSREEIHALLGSAPFLRSVSEQNESQLRALEGQWHKVFISWQSLLGQLKVQQRQVKPKSFLASLFGTRTHAA